ncbi:DUF177 domain-containing protein [Paracoccus sp. 11-3]|uniref:DUF177 domain-containing protein n=1 Tax=Paracoccus amoyensis TaxID=2760093 RepID=A0A926GEH1_9RHOB|nr:DUF177 domain-containing protein [Paracoccus amoyensis]MBC9247695.1 DUF177 domain-containing protein [Paracoccus amoyensis]
MTAQPLSPTRLRVAHLNPRAPTQFDLRPDSQTRIAIAQELGLLDLPKLQFKGAIRAEGGHGWEVTGQLTARVVQPCVITLKPVKTSLDEQVERHFSPHVAVPDGDEIEMLDETVEPLGQFIDLSAVMIEELTLALPEYPRADGAELAEDAVEDDTPDTRRPFQGLDQLLQGKKDD